MTHKPLDPYDWDLHAYPHQLPPPGTRWHTWVLVGGRGAGRTRAAAEYIRAQVAAQGADDRPLKILLVGQSYQRVRDIMVEGSSGLMSVTPPNERPEYHVGARKLVWPNGSVAYIHSAQETSDRLRGLEFDLAWGDDVEDWTLPLYETVRLAVRLGLHPRMIFTMLPPVPSVRPLTDMDKILERDMIRDPAGVRYGTPRMSPAFVERLVDRYGPDFLDKTGAREYLFGGGSNAWFD